MIEEQEQLNSNSLTDWAKEPTIAELKEDFLNCKSSHDKQMAKITDYLSNLNPPKPDKKKGSTRSTVQSKLIKKHAEWRASSLIEAFFSTPNIFKVNPVTYSDGYSAKQNELVLNYQFNTQLDKVKLIDEYVRCAVETGTSILRVGWEEFEDIKDIPVPQYQIVPIDPSESEAFEVFDRINRDMQDPIRHLNVPDQWKQAVLQANQEQQAREQQVAMMVQEQLTAYAQQGVPQEQLQEMEQQLVQQQLQSMPPIAYQPIQVGTAYSQDVKVINRPTVEMCQHKDVYIDPSCEGNLDKAEYIIYKFTSCKADLLKDGRYSNVDEIPDTTARDFDDNYSEADNLKDPARRKITVYEYWGNWDIDGNGTKKPIVATWVSNTMIRLEENPYPDHKPPFVIVPYVPEFKEVYGVPDGDLIAPNQAILGAITRSTIDLLAKSANSQTGIAINFLDPINKKAFFEGRDYEYNPSMQPQQAIFQHTFSEIPQTIIPFMQSLEFDAEALTGVKGFSQGMDGASYGNTATGARGVMDAASKREMGILRRLADGLKKVARKIIAMNALWLNEEEVIRITEQDFVEVKRDDLAGNYDLELTISSAEEDDAKSQELGFLMQTMGPNMPPEMSQIILSEICRLKKMPELAQRIAIYQPQPDPIEEEKRKLEVEYMRAEVAKKQAETQKLGADAQLSGAKAQTAIMDSQLDAQLKPQELMSKIQSELSKARYNDSLAKKLDLDYMNDIGGINHQRDLEKQGAQAKAQADKAMQEQYMKYQIEKLKAKNKGSK